MNLVRRMGSSTLIYTSQSARNIGCSLFTKSEPDLFELMWKLAVNDEISLLYEVLY